MVQVDLQGFFKEVTTIKGLRYFNRRIKKMI